MGCTPRIPRDARRRDAPTPMTTPPPLERPTVRAPSFPDGLDWIHTGGRALTLQDLRGKVVVLDFWTYG